MRSNFYTSIEANEMCTNVQVLVHTDTDRRLLLVQHPGSVKRPPFAWQFPCFLASHQGCADLIYPPIGLSRRDDDDDDDDDFSLQS